MATHTRANLLLLLTAAIWGVAFVAQRVGMNSIGPFTFNGIRFALGACSLLPLLFQLRGRRDDAPESRRSRILAGGLAAGVVMFIGASLQQIGIVYTTAGNAGFITGLYVVIVPIVGIFLKQTTTTNTWIGAVFAVLGMYLLSVNDALRINRGDVLELIGAFFWAAHVQLIGWLTRRINPLKIAFLQFLTCSCFSLFAALLVESITWQSVARAAIPLAYGGFLSVGVAFTLQVVAQRDAQPAHAAIILSLEAVFAALGGWLILGERLSARGVVGCGLMLIGMLISQALLTRNQFKRLRTKRPEERRENSL